MVNKRAKVTDRSPLDAFLDDEPQAPPPPPKDVNTLTDQHVNAKPTGFYLRTDQNRAINRLVLELDERGIKRNRSAIVRVAIDQLLEKNITEIVNLLTD